MTLDLQGLIGKDAWAMDCKIPREVVGWRLADDMGPELAVLDEHGVLFWYPLEWFECFGDAGEGRPHHLTSVPDYPS